MKQLLNKAYALQSIVLASLFLLSSCNKNNEIEEFEMSTIGAPMSIFAEISTSKTANSGMSTEWSSGDALTAIHNKTGQSTVYSSKFTYTGTGTKFNGNVTETGEYNDWYLVYPYNADNKKADEISVSVNTNPEQTDVNSTAHLAGEKVPLFGIKLNVPTSESGIEVSMKNALSVAKFNVTNTLSVPITITGIEFTSIKEIAGDFKVNLKKLEWEPKDNATKKISLSVTGNAELKAGETGIFCAAIVPHDIPVGSNLIIAIKAKREDKDVVPCYISKTIVDATSFEAGEMKKINISYDEEHQKDPTAIKGYKLITSEPSDWSGKYVLVSADKKSVFTGDKSTSNSYTFQSGDLDDGVIVKDCSSYEFTISKSGSNYYLNHGENYLYCSYSSGGDGTTGMAYSNSKKALNLAIQTDGTFGFWMNTSGTNQYLYYKSTYFKFGGSHSNHCVYLYKYDDGDTPTGKEYQNLSFDNSSVEWQIGSTYQIEGTFDMPQAVNGAKTTVTYSSSETSVATISGTKITLKGKGTTTITANAVETDKYFAGTASYTLTIGNESEFNIENDNLKNYLDYVTLNPYSTTNYTYTHVTPYYQGTGEKNRLDFPKPVNISWSGSNASKITVYTNSTMSDVEWSQNVSGNSAKIYNMVPGNTYYYKVTDSEDKEVAKGQFNTTGRRRMIKVGESYGAGYANNCRDLGGQVTTSGKTITFKKIYRGSNLDNINEEEIKFLKEYLNVKLEVELRGEGSSPLNVKVSNQRYDEFNDIIKTERIKITIGDIFDAVANNEVVYIHCTYGADRTGYICLLLESLLGIPQERCDVDYEITSFSGAVGKKPRTNNYGDQNWYYAQAINYITNLSGTTFQEKVVNYFVNTLGISQERVTAFQNSMLQ